MLAPIVASRSAILPFPIKGGKLFLYNNNPLLVLRYPGTDGVKTGFTDAAGQCLVATRPPREGVAGRGVAAFGRHLGPGAATTERGVRKAFPKLIAGTEQLGA